MGRTKKKYYAVARGRKPSIYDKWYGEDGAEIQVSGFPKAIFKGHACLGDAKEWLKGFGKTETTAHSEPKRPKPTPTPQVKSPKVSPSVDCLFILAKIS